MPLVTISGLPLSGKTTRAKELKAFLLENAIINGGSTSTTADNANLKNVVIVNEELLGIDKKTAYTGTRNHDYGCINLLTKLN